MLKQSTCAILLLFTKHLSVKACETGRQIRTVFNSHQLILQQELWNSSWDSQIPSTLQFLPWHTLHWLWQRWLHLPACQVKIKTWCRIWHKKWCYCWWTKSCTSWYGKYPFFFWVLYIPGGAGFHPSTVAFFLFFAQKKSQPWFLLHVQKPCDHKNGTCHCSGHH